MCALRRRGIIIITCSGVIQGLLLGPTLFTGVINDLPSQLETCKIFLFADDGKAVGPARSTVDRDAVQRDLHTIGGWSYRNGLPLNIEKCVYLHYGSKNHKSNYVINNQPVQNADSSADLGVIRTCNFRYNDHANQICLKASRLAGMVFKLFSSKDIHFLTQVFISYVRPLTEYACVIWNPADVSSCVQLERIQRRFMRRALGMPTLQFRRRAFELIFTYKLMHGLIDVDAKAIGLQMLSSNTRGNGVNVCVRRAKSNCIKKSFSYRIPKDWNELPMDIKSA